MAIIELQDVSKTYANGCAALARTSLHIEKGQFVSIIGPSGAGKTTLIRLINGLEQATSGSVVTDNLRVCKHHLKKIRLRVGMVFQHFNLVDQLNVMTNVLCGRLAHAPWLPSLFYLFRRADREAAEAALGRVGLLEKAWERADKLSGGQQQRVGVARALAQHPKVILADEPVASLDPVIGRGIIELLKDISQNDGITVVANLHQVRMAKEFSDRIIGLNGGRVVFDDHPSRLDEEALHYIYHGKTKAYSREDKSANLAVANC
jgi:phosphonate transport system ATP-binding protein